MGPACQRGRTPTTCRQVGAREYRDPMLPDDVRIVSVDDHVIEHRDVWQDRLPEKFKEQGPRSVRTDDGPGRVDARGQPAREHRAQRGRRQAVRGIRRRPRELRRDDPGLLRHQRARPRHGHGRYRRAAVLPQLPGLRGRHLLRRRRQGARGRMRVGVERLARRRVVRGCAGTPDPARARTVVGRRGIGRRGASRRGPGYPGGVVQRGAPQLRVAVVPHRPLGPVLRRCSRRPTSRCASTSAAAARRPSPPVARSPRRSRCSG